MRSLGHEVIPVILGGTERAAVDEYHAEITGKNRLKGAVKSIIPKALLNAFKDLMLIRHDKKAAQELAAAIEKHRPDLVYERNEYMQDKGTLLCKKLGVQHYLEVNSPGVDEMRDFEGPSLLHFLGHIKEKNKLKNTDRIFAVSTALGAYLKDRYNIKKGITVIPNCIDPDKEKPDLQRVAELQARLNTKDKTVIGFVGSIFPYHGVDKLILAFEKLIRSQPLSKMVIVGGGVLKDQLEAQAMDTLPEGSFYFAGKVPHSDVMNYISLFDIAVMPASNWYGSPVKVLEYGLLGKPVIAPDNGPLNDLIENGKEGILVGESTEELAAALDRSIKQPAEMAAIGAAFREKIFRDFTWKKQAETILGPGKWGS